MNSINKNNLKDANSNKTGILGSTIVLPQNYVPSDIEDYMNDNQLEFFRQKLLSWKNDLLKKLLIPRITYPKMDFNGQILRIEPKLKVMLLYNYVQEIERKLISKIDAALRRIDLGTYGYCEETDEPIGVKRLIARPIASLCLDAQERHEKMERIHKDD